MSIVLKPVILVVDGEESSLETASSVLQTEEYEILRVKTREHAIEISANNQLDMIICDLDIDQIDGYDLVEEIRRLPDRNDVPAMFASRHQLPDIVLKNSSFGASYHLRKPIDPRAMLELVETALWLPHLVTSHVTNHQAETSIKKPHFSISSNPVHKQEVDKQEVEKQEVEKEVDSRSEPPEETNKEAGSKIDTQPTITNCTFVSSTENPFSELGEIATPSNQSAEINHTETTPTVGPGMTTQVMASTVSMETNDVVNQDDSAKQKEDIPGIISRRFRPTPHFNLKTPNQINQNQ